LGEVRLYHADEYQERVASRIGKDALDASASDLIGQFGKSKTPIKVALLDQKRLAGVGNLYASELLHLAKVHPRKPCRRLKPDQWQAIHRAMHRVLNEAIRFEGSTLSDGTYRNALNQPGEFQTKHRVYDRKGERCLTCRKSAIERIVQAQRATFFCPNCQLK
jgi:formamidopyrimidine-DNA glycosylase